MADITILPHEALLLQELLESTLSDLRMEIANTDSQDYREKLKSRKRALQNVLTQIEEISRPRPSRNSKDVSIVR
jgi:hypothetical protein